MIKYVSAYVVVFIIVSGIIFYLNTSYNNIFQLDFSPPAANKTEQSKTVSGNAPAEKQKDTVNIKEPANQFSDSKDTVKQLAAPQDSIKQFANIQETVKTQEKPGEISRPVNQVNQNNSPVLPEREVIPFQVNKSDTSYVKWVRQTVQLLESMEAKKASRIINNYPEDTARELLYKMKKKKAAEVLAEFDPDTANRLMRFKE